MQCAGLNDADLTGANLTGANLSQAELAGAILTGARLEGADLSTAIGLEQRQVLSAMHQGQGAKLPATWSPDWRAAWESLAAEGLEIHEISGEHLEIFDEPYRTAPCRCFARSGRDHCPSDHRFGASRP